MNEKLTQSEFLDVQAYFDGEMPEAQARAFRDRLQARPDLARALAQLEQLDGALDGWTVPAADADLARRVVNRVRARTARSVPLVRLLRWGGTLAAAAAVVVAALLWFAPSSQPPSDPPGAQKPGQTVEVSVEQLCVQDYGLVENYQVLVNFETLEEIDRLEAEGGI
jgi:anti-sigma factor RsiW